MNFSFFFHFCFAEEPAQEGFGDPRLRVPRFFFFFFFLSFHFLLIFQDSSPIPIEACGGGPERHHEKMTCIIMERRSRLAVCLHPIFDCWCGA